MYRSGICVLSGLLVCLMGLAASANAGIDLGSGASEIQAHSGSFTHNIPIAAAPGVAGMQPALQLNYSSSQGNSMYGYGWGLNVARIERSLKKGKPLYTDADVFVLWMNGSAMELVAIGDGQYRAKREGAFLHITKIGNRWEVLDKEGTKYHFGWNDDVVTPQKSSWPQGVAQSFSWHLSKVVDTHGNFMRYYYLDDADGHRLGQVNYAPNNTLVLDYQTRPAKDRRWRYNTGYQKMFGARLISAKSYANGVLAYDLSFEYTQLDAKDHRSLLWKVSNWPVSASGSTGAGLVLSPKTTEFNYAGKHIGLASAAGYGYPDINGDMDDDRITASHGDPNNRLWTYYGIFAQVSPSYADSAAYSFDMGKGNACALVPEGGHVSRFKPAGSYGLVDLNGDGLLDKVIIDAHVTKTDNRSVPCKVIYDGSFKVYYNTGSGYSATPVTWNDPVKFTFAGAKRSRGDIVDGWGFADVNGDGLKDRVSLFTYQNGLLGGVSGIFLNTGSGFETTSFATTTPVIGYGGLQNDSSGHISISAWANSPLMSSIEDLSSHLKTNITYASQVVDMSNGKEMAVWTATNISTSGPGVETRSASNNYKEGFFDDPSKEFRGFATVEQTDDQSGLVTETGYHQDAARMGLPMYTESRTASRTVLSRTDNTFAVKNLGQGRTWAHLSASTVKQYELNTGFKSPIPIDPIAAVPPAPPADVPISPTPIPDPVPDTPAVVTNMSMTYDDYGNILISSKNTSDGFGKQTTNTYENNAQCGTIQKAVTTMVNVTKTRYINKTGYRWIQYPNTPAYVYNSANYIQYKAWYHPTKPNGPYAYNNAATYFSGLYYKRIGRDGPYQMWGGYWETYTYQVAETYTVLEPQTTLVNFPDPDCWMIGKLVRAEVISTSPTDTIGVTRVSAFQYDATGYMIKEIIEPDNAALRLDTDYTYDTFGNRLTTTVSGSGITPHTTAVTYDINGLFPISTTNALGHAESYTWDARFGVKTSLTGPNGLTTSWEYDDFGKKVAELRADGTRSDIVYHLTAAPFYVKEQSTGLPAAFTYYDAKGRETRSEGVLFDGAAVYVNTQYDSLGRVARKSLPYKGVVLAGPTAWTTYTYDEIGRAISVTAPNGDVATTAHDGLTTVSTNPLGQTTSTVKDSQGNTVSVTDHLGGMMHYGYDALGNLTDTTDASGNITTMTYDLLGRKTGMNDPDMGIWSYQYDLLGNLISQTDAKNQSTIMTYDELGRMTSRTEPEGISTWVYDMLWIGALTSESGPTSSKAYSYDLLGRVATSITTVNGQNFAVGTAYDAIGRVDTITYPQSIAANRLVVKRNYNAQGFMSHLTSPTFVSANNANGLVWQADTVDEFGHTTSESFGNGVVTNRVYDNLRGVMTGMQSVSGATTVQNWSYDYDAGGNMLFRTDNVMGHTENFAYDGLNRLTSVTGPSNKNYAYDAIGNITSKSDVGAYTYDPNHPHAVATSGGNSYAYDANGNMLSGAGRSLSWTSFNKPAHIRKDMTDSWYSYDANHNRLTKSTVTSNTIYIGKLYEKFTAGAVEIHRNFIHVGGKTVAMVREKSGLPTAMHYEHGDHLGSITAFTGESGNVALRRSFAPFGEASGAPAGSASFRTFTGHEFDAESGLINMNARLYDPVLGRFISADTVIPNPGNMQDFNRYSYVRNNPLFYTDPSGHVVDPVILGLVIGAIVGGVTAGVQSDWDAGSVLFGAMTGALMGAVGGKIWGMYGFEGSAATAFSPYIAAASTGAHFGAMSAGMSGGGWDAVRKGAIFGAIGGAMTVGFANAGLNIFSGPAAAYITTTWASGSDDGLKAMVFAFGTAVLSSVASGMLPEESSPNIGLKGGKEIATLSPEKGGVTTDVNYEQVTTGMFGLLNPVKWLRTVFSVLRTYISGNNVTFKGDHGYRHIQEASLTKELPRGTVESSIRNDINSIPRPHKAVGWFEGRVNVNGYTVQYRAMPVGDKINVGTYFPIF